jgi:antirestriction protein ArdC
LLSSHGFFNEILLGGKQIMKPNEIITQKFIDMIKAGVNPWKRPWKIIIPQNFISKKPYNGVNRLLLSLSNFNNPFFVTFNQAEKLGYKIRKGSKSEIVVFEKDIIKTEQHPDDKELIHIKDYHVLKYYHVFNLEQLEGFTPPKDDKIILSNSEQYKNVKHIIKDYHTRHPFTLRFGGSEAFLRPKQNLISLPKMKDFISQDAFYEIFFHELGHHTGIYLKRELSMMKSEYSKEELTAELTSSFLMHYFGLNTDLNNSAGYLAGWLKPLQNDHNFIISAAAKAQKAFNLILNILEETKENGN